MPDFLQERLNVPNAVAAEPIAPPEIARQTPADQVPLQPPPPNLVPQDPNAPIPVRNALGQVRTLPANRVQEAFATGQATPATQQELEAQREKDYYDSTLQRAAAFAEGALRGGSLGLYDPIMRAAAPEYMEDIAARKRQHPWLEGAGEVTGMVAGAVGAGALGAVGAATPMGALEASGGLAEAAATRGLAAAGIEGTAARVVPQVARQATEGAIIGAGQYTSEAALGNHDMRAEELLASAGGGALIGAGFGAALGLGGKLLTRAAEETGPALGKELVERGGFDIEGRPIGKAAFGSKEWAERKSVEKGFEATGGRPSQIEKFMAPLTKGEARFMDLTPEEYQSLVRDTIFNKAPEAIGKKNFIGKVLLPEEQVLAFEKIAESAEKDLTNSYKAISAIHPSGRANTTKVVDIVRMVADSDYATVADQFENRLMNRWAKEIEKKYSSGEIHLLDAHKELIDIEHKMFKATDPIRAQALSDMSTILRTELDRATEESVQHLNQVVKSPEIAKLVAELHDLRPRLHVASELLAAAKFGAHHRPNPFGNIEGALVGSILGNIYSPVAGAALGLTKMGWDYAKKYADPAISRAYNAYSEHGIGLGIIKAADRSSKSIASGVSGFLGSAAKAAAKAPVRHLYERLNPASYGELRYMLAQRKDDPKILADEIDSTGMSETHPKIAMTLFKRAQTANDFLFSKLPRQIERPSITGPVAVPPSDADLRKFQKYLDIVRDPLAVLDHLRENTLTPEMVETIRAVYPTLFEEIRGQIVSETAAKVAGGKKGKEKLDIPYDKKVALGFLFGTAADPTMTPEYLHAMRIYSRTSGGQNKKENTAIPTSAQMQSIKSVPSRQTRTDRIGSK
jgi:hypothetical protein